MNSQGYPLQKILYGLAASTVLANIWFVWQWTRSRHTLRIVAEQFQESESLSRRIEFLRREPLIFEEVARSSESINRLCESAAKAAGVESEQVIEIAPRSPRRLENSPYQEQVTHLELRQLTIRQLFQFVTNLRNLDNGIHVRFITLREPSSEETTQGKETWNVQLALTTYLYTPKLPSQS